MRTVTHSAAPPDPAPYAAAERQDPEHGKRWVALVDGAEPQLDLVEASAAAYGVDVTVVLDIIHVVEYVWKAAHVFHREGSELACWAWTRVGRILAGKARQAAAMRRAATVAGLSKDTRKPVDTCADYLLKYAPYLHYDRYLAAGYPIATGVIEGACRYLVRDRMKRLAILAFATGAEHGVRRRATGGLDSAEPDGRSGYASPDTATYPRDPDTDRAILTAMRTPGRNQTVARQRRARSRSTTTPDPASWTRRTARATRESSSSVPSGK